ncbi:MAG: helix-turn-helix domain containing protein [Paeniclostridium sordellii]|nr:helix-turn-helix domain containing protein [Paeniclostridium sordellii]
MSKLDLKIGTEKIEINNTLDEFLNDFVLVKKSNIDKLDKLEIERYTLTDDNDTFYIVKQGRKPKKFNEQQVQQIKQDLENGLSIRKAADKHKTSTRLIQLIKNSKY